MAQPLPKNALDSAANPSEIVQQKFDVERRGFDQRQVREYLRAVSDSLQDAQRREAEMRTRLGKAIRRAEAAEQALREVPEPDPSDESRQVGDEVTAVLDAARAAGEQRTAAAEKSAEQMMANAKTEATKMRKEADTILRDRRAEADASAKDIIAEGKAKADAICEQACAEADEMRAKAASQVTRARNESDGLIREAEEARAQILEDMERRRRQARAQVERLRVGRDRLLRSYEVVRRTLEETTVELKSSLKEAKVKGDTAARAVAAEPMANRQQLEAEIADAKMIGRIKISEPAVELSGQDADTTADLDRRSAIARALQSPALPRRLDPPQVAPLPLQPKAPAVAPLLTATDVSDASDTASDANPADADIADGEPIELTDEPVDAELANLEDDNLDVVEPGDDIEEVLAVPTSAQTPDPAAPGLFAALREQSAPDDQPVAEAPTSVTQEFPGIEAQRDAVVADAAKQLEKRLKRALADEQNELLAAIRASKKSKKKKSVALTAVVGDIDHHVNRYVIAVKDVAVITYGAGAALIDAEPNEGHLPAGAVEELLAADVVLPLRERLESLDALEVSGSDQHVDPVRAFYRQRKTDHLGFAASRLASLLCVAGLCDALPPESTVPWNQGQRSVVGAK